MKPIPQWKVAQVGEKGLWDGVIHEDYYILYVLAANAARVPSIRRILSPTPASCIEIGIGPFGLGLSAFLPEITHRFSVDPLPPVPLASTPGAPLNSTEEIRSYMGELREPVRYVRALGEELPFSNDAFDFAICCNVLDHVSEPDTLLHEIHRVLRPGGRLFFDVDTFSMLGLLKWHTYTKYAHKTEILVTTHPYRMWESDVVRRLQSSGFRLQKINGHSFGSNLIGSARESTYLGTKCTP
jgi:SAM-dependent methyltransferase